jgi:hypothetical protein
LANCAPIIDAPMAVVRGRCPWCGPANGIWLPLRVYTVEPITVTCELARDDRHDTVVALWLADLLRAPIAQLIEEAADARR